ncbi:MAG: TerB N-terminal domain-containing protein [Clostridia bacterium]|nr:TerB N-terminal domain-containing protein [Clostridia bacterium]
MSDGSRKDDYWNIERLVPKRRGLSPFATREQVTGYESEAPEEAKKQDARADLERKLTIAPPEGQRAASSHSYTPGGAGLITKVTVKRFADKYDFYDSFRKAAELYYDVKGSPAEFAQFYSYMPQYAHMTAAQKAYYFFWRSELRQKRYIKTDYSYLYLYVYEILNLPERIPPEEGIRLLCEVWREYRQKLPRIDGYFAIWVEDYCLVHGLESPVSLLSDVLFDCISYAPLKEFYLSDIREAGFRGVDALLAYLSDYDYKRGKYAAERLPESITRDASYRDHFVRAMYLLFSEVYASEIIVGAQKTATLTRDAFPNSLCTHSVKCKLEIEYLALGESEELRRRVTAAVRYTENKLRAILGVKSRLAVKELPPHYARIIDGYFADLTRAAERRRAEKSRPQYERLYEPTSTGLSIEGASEIERLSWSTTARLTEPDEILYPTSDSFAIENGGEATRAENSHEISDIAARAENTLDISYASAPDGDLPSATLGARLAPDSSDEPQAPSAQATAATDDQNSSAGSEDGASPLGKEELDYLNHLYLGMPLTLTATPKDTLAERINDAFLDIIGDVILEPGDLGYAIIEDYREDIEEWLHSHQ